MFIICHKPTDLPAGECFVPLHVGRKNSALKEEMSDYVGDDSGDNISEKNPYFCEATGIYWVWKNVHDCDYVGICHYRRFFDYEFTDSSVDSLFKDGTEVVFSKKLLQPHTRWHGIMMYAQIEDLMILRGAIRKVCPEYLNSLNSYWRGFRSHAFNMLICKKELYDKYAEWLFTICFEVEKYAKPSNYSNSRRAIAYMTEMLTPLYFYHNQCKIKELPIIVDGKTVKTSWLSKVCYFILKNTVWRISRNHPVFVDPSVFRGLKQDGIDLDCEY